jgi:hypothetical protein
MSVSHTEAAVRARRKTVTRRRGWLFLKAGDRLTLCRKVMGLRLGEKVEQITEVEVLSVRRERLDAITAADIEREAVPAETFTPDLIAGAPRVHEMACADCRRANWIGWFARTMGGGVDQIVTRIEWRYLG